MFQYSLKVGSCLNDGNSVEILFCPFLCSIRIILCSEALAAQKKRKILLKMCGFFVCLFPLCGNSDLKIVLSPAHKWVTSDVILWKLDFLLS